MNRELNHKQDTFVPAGNDNRAYTVDDLRNILKVSKTSVYRLLRSKCFHYVRIGGQYRISKRALITGLMVRKEELKMAFVNMFNERVELFNLKEENERLAELFSDEKLQEEALWEAYSVKEISKLLSVTEEEALKLMNCGIFKTYRVGNEYRASKKSVEENKKVIKAVLTYQDKKTMSVPDVMRILGLGKTATYRLINQCRFKTYLVMGKMRVDVDSFEDWYSGQFHYEKVNGERPGKKYGKTISPLTVAKVLGIPRSTANDLMNDGIVDFIWVDGKRRIKRESFDKWYGSQTKYNKVKEIEESCKQKSIAEMKKVPQNLHS